MIKLIATDMDGTFLDAHGAYDEARFRNVLDGLRAKGIRFAVASGRAYLALERLFAPFKDDIIFIAENGSLVMDKGIVRFEALMAKAFYLQIVESLETGPFGSQDRWLVSGRRGAYVLDTAPEDYVTHVSRYYDNVCRVKDFSSITDDVFKITAKLGPEHVKAGAEWLTAHIPGVTAMVTGFDSVDIIRDDVDKQTGLAHLCQELGLQPEEIVAFGDNLNDYEMLSYAGTAIATGNAREEIKAIADEVIGPCSEGSVLAYLEELV